MHLMGVFVKVILVLNEEDIVMKEIFQGLLVPEVDQTH